MAETADVVETVKQGYAFEGAAIELGALLVDDEPKPEAAVRIPLSMVNRHGLVAGATGTGKTKTLQLMAEQLSAAGVAVFAADIKGDLSGISQPGEGNDKLLARTKSIGQDWTASGFPTEFYALGGQGTGIPIRATITSFGPVLLSKVLGLNDVQESSLGLIFHYADKAGLTLLDLKDLRAVIQHLTSDEGKDDLKELGGLSAATAGVILRSLIGFADQGAEAFFGEPEFDTADLMQQRDGKGVISLLELPNLQDRPALFSTFLMWLLADLFHDLPEVGDVDKPKLVFFFDEAHLLFNDASKAFLDSIAQTVRLIRSKGVGVFFVTQTPKDVPDDVLAQLGSRVQHQLRAHTPNDAKALKATVSTFPSVVVRPGRGADPARDRRGDRDGDEREGRADAGRVDPVAGAAVADGAGLRGAADRLGAGVAEQREVHRGDRPRVGVRDARRQGAGRCRAGRGRRSRPSTAAGGARGRARQKQEKSDGRAGHRLVGLQAVRPLRRPGDRPRALRRRPPAQVISCPGREFSRLIVDQTTESSTIGHRFQLVIHSAPSRIGTRRLLVVRCEGWLRRVGERYGPGRCGP